MSLGEFTGPFCQPGGVRVMTDAGDPKIAVTGDHRGTGQHRGADVLIDRIGFTGNQRLINIEAFRGQD